MADATINVQKLWKDVFVPWTAGFRIWQTVGPFATLETTFNDWDTIWSETYYPWYFLSYPWLDQGIIAGTGVAITADILSATNSLASTTETEGTGDSFDQTKLQLTSAITDPTLALDCNLSPDTIEINSGLKNPSIRAFGSWDDRTKPSTNWTDRTKPSSSWNERSKPSTNWTSIKK